MSDIARQDEGIQAEGHPALLVRTTSIMVHVPWWNDQLVKFLNSDHAEPDADRGRPRKFFLDRTDWEEMGKPETITTIVVPGDGLNEEDR